MQLLTIENRAAKERTIRLFEFINRQAVKIPLLSLEAKREVEEEDKVKLFFEVHLHIEVGKEEEDKIVELFQALGITLS